MCACRERDSNKTSNLYLIHHERFRFTFLAFMNVSKSFHRPSLTVISVHVTPQNCES